jgi:hypothetical protein
MRCVSLAAIALLALGFVGASGASGRARLGAALIVGEVRVCNAPGRCMTRAFQVSAIDGVSYGVDNRFRLAVPSGRYSLSADSDGLRCERSGVVVATKTVTANITCLVP